jgi:hypothetical protein
LAVAPECVDLGDLIGRVLLVLVEDITQGQVRFVLPSQSVINEGQADTAPGRLLLLLHLPERRWRVRPREVDHAEPDVRAGVLGDELEDPAKRRFRLVEPACIRGMVAEVVVVQGAQWVELDRTLGQTDRFLEAALAGGDAGRSKDGLCAPGLELQGPLVGGVRSRPVPVVGQSDPAQRRVRLGQVRIEREGSLDLPAREPTADVEGDVTPVRLVMVGLRQAHPCACVGGVEPQGPLVIGDGLLQALTVPTSGEVSPLQEEAVGLGVPGGRERGRAASQQRHLQGPRHRACDLVLDPEDVVQLAIIGLRPQVKAIGRIDQVCRDPDPVACLPHAALEERCDLKSPADRAQVLGLALELKGGCPPDHTQLGHSRQRVQQLLRQAVREILLVLAGTHV